MIKLVPSVFQGGGKDGDFGWMIEQDAYANALFVYNDNLTQSTDFLDQVEARETPTECGAGDGNAVIRPYQCEDPPRAAGVPTGPGWKTLADGKAAIDRALAYIKTRVEKGRYDRLIYSAASDSDPGKLGSGIFSPPDDVLSYIPAELKRIVAEANGA